jgi:glycosyltransferase 2 family protein
MAKISGGQAAGDAVPPVFGVRLLAGGLAFAVLTGGIFWYQLHRIPAGEAGVEWSGLRWSVLPLLLLCIPIETVACALRIWLLARVLQPGLSFWTCVKSEWANVAIAMLTPSQSGGGPGQIYILARGGARVGTALTISLLSFLGTMVGLLGMGLYSLLVTGMAATGPLFLAAVWSLIAIAAAMALGASCPGLFRVALAALSRALHRLGPDRFPLGEWWPPAAARGGPAPARMTPLAARLADLVYTYRDDVRRFLKVGKASFGWVCLLSLVFLLARCLLPYLCLRFLGLDAGLGRVVELQMALIFLVFFAPTPGGAGVAEAASLSIMDELVPVGLAPAYTLLWRFSTLYVGAIAGLVCLGAAMLADARRSLRSARPVAPAGEMALPPVSECKGGIR